MLIVTHWYLPWFDFSILDGPITTCFEFCWLLPFSPEINGILFHCRSNSTEKKREIIFLFYYIFLQAVNWYPRFSITAIKQAAISILFIKHIKYINYHHMRSLTYILNSSGPSTAPWGTRCFSSIQSETIPFIVACVYLFVKKFSMHSAADWENFSDFNVFRRILHENESKASDEYKTTAWIELPFFNCHLMMFQYCKEKHLAMRHYS